MKTAILRECTGMCDYMILQYSTSRDIQSDLGKRWEIPALVSIPEILAAAVGAFGGQSLSDEAQW